MHDFIDCLTIWLGEPSRRTVHRLAQRAAALLAQPPAPLAYDVLPTMPRYARGPLPAHVLARQRPIDGHALDLVRPYLRAHEGHAAAFRACA